MCCRHSNIPGAGEAGMDGGHDRQVFCTGAGEQNNSFRPYECTSLPHHSHKLLTLPLQMPYHFRHHACQVIWKQHAVCTCLATLCISTGVGKTAFPDAGTAGAHHKPAKAPAGQPDAVPGIRAHNGRQACPITPRHLQLRPQRLCKHFECNPACRDQASYMNCLAWGLWRYIR